MIYNRFIAVNTRLKSTPLIWAGRILLMLTFVFRNLSGLQQTYDSFYLSPLSALGFSAKVALASVIISGIFMGVLLYAIYGALARFAYISMQRNIAYTGGEGIDYSFFRTAYDWPVIAAGILSGIFELLNVFYPARLLNVSSLLGALFALAAIAASLTILCKKVRKEDIHFVIAGATALNIMLLIV